MAEQLTVAALMPQRLHVALLQTDITKVDNAGNKEKPVMLGVSQKPVYPKAASLPRFINDAALQQAGYFVPSNAMGDSRNAE